MTALEAFPELALSKVAFSCPIPSFSKQIQSRGSARQSAAGKDAEASQRQSREQELCLSPSALLWHPLPKTSTLSGPRGPVPLLGSLKAPII